MFFFHGGHALVKDPHRRMNHPVNPWIYLLNGVVGRLQGFLIPGIRRHINGGMAQPCKGIQFALNGGVHGAAADPDDAGPVLLDHQF